jgi:nicotinamidase-related amidase
MALPKLNPSTTALLLLDYQPSVLARLPPATASSVKTHASNLLDTARSNSFKSIVFVRVAFSPEELSQAAQPSCLNFSIQALAANPQIAPNLLLDAPASQINPELAPKEGETVVRKTRYGVFMRGEGLECLTSWKDNGIQQVVIGGVSTSGSVLSSVRQLADLDFGLYVVEDACADLDEEVHRVLMEKVFHNKQAVVLREAEVNGYIA